jgi:geranylgeranyl reductase family protein
VERFDVAIAGAGPAGSSAAYHLAARGARVLLLDRAIFPRYKTCGGGVVGRARRWLPVPIDRAVEHECPVAEVHLLDAGLCVRETRAEPVVSMTMRSTLDALLADAAAGRGATVRTGERVTSIEATGRDSIVRTPRGSIAAGFVIAADGATGTTARAAGFPPNPGAVPALECEVRVADNVFERFAGTARFDFGSVDHGYAWVFPKQDRLSIGVLTTRRGRAGLEERLRDYLERLRITEVLHIERHGYVIPLRPAPGPLVRHRTMVVGDAAGLADPITAEGISGAALSGRLAAEAIIAGYGDESRTRIHYEGAVRRALLPELRSARGYARLLYDFPRLRAFCVRHGGKRLLVTIADVMCGTRTYADALGGLARLPRLLWRARGAAVPELPRAARGTQVR